MEKIQHTNKGKNQIPLLPVMKGGTNMKLLRVCVILLTTLLLLNGCRVRLHTDSATPYTQATPPPEYEYVPMEEIEEILPPPEPPPADYDITPPESPEEEETEYTPPPYIEAYEDDFSPEIVEVVSEDPRQYASGYCDMYDTATVGVQAENDDDANIITINTPAEYDIEEQAVLGDDGGVVGIVDENTALLRQGVNTLFPCQLLYVYCETATDLVTVGRGSTMYQLMVSAGGVNVSTRLTSDRLAVSEDWVIRRNPDVIVKFVDSAVLGSGVSSLNRAMDVRAAIASREDWGTIEAVRNNRIILFSEEMLNTDESRLAVKLLVSRMMYPELFAEMDVDSVVFELIGRMDGVHVLV